MRNRHITNGICSLQGPDVSVDKVVREGINQAKDISNYMRTVLPPSTYALHISDFSYPTMLQKTMDLTVHKCIREGPYFISKPTGNNKGHYFSNRKRTVSVGAIKYFFTTRSQLKRSETHTSPFLTNPHSKSQ